MPPFSARSRFRTDQNALTRARETAQVRYDLTESNPTRVGLGLPGALLSRLLADPEVAHYTPEPFGLLAAREAIARDLSARGHAVEARHVMLTASTSEAYGFLFKLLCDPGDAVLVPAPSYPLLDVLAQLEQVELVPYRLAYDGEWHLEQAELQRALAAHPRPRALVIVHPNNPTGSFLKRDELARIAALGLPLISDEVFADYVHGVDARRADSALEAADRTLVFRLSGLSKVAALPQLKLAWTALAGPSGLLDEARARLEHVADSYLSASAPAQLALSRLLAASEPVRSAIRERVQTNLTVLRALLADGAASVLRVEGGWYAIVRLPAVLDDEAWALTLLREDQVLVQPGYYYDLLDGAHVVLSLIGDEASTHEGFRRLAARVAAQVG